MAKQSKRLTAVTVKALTAPGRHSDGDNLYLLIDKAGGKRWVYLYKIDGRQREAGFGPVATVTLATAREKAAGWRRLIAAGVDPLEEKRAASDAAKSIAARLTFGQCADDFLKAKSPEWRSAKHKGQWTMTLREYAAPLRALPVDEIDTAAVTAVLQPLWARAPATAMRLRGRIENVLDAARARGLIPPDRSNPARWKGHLDKLLPKRQKLTRRHHAALEYSGVPEFVARIRDKDSVGAFALEFVILTAARTGEVLGAKWSEIDVESKIWTVSADRMKAGRAHRVPVSDRALEIVARQAAVRTSVYVFPGAHHGRPLSGWPLQNLAGVLSGGTATPHGFRSSFRDWAGDKTDFPREVIEAALAHAVGDETERSYRRGDALEKRRELMAAWARFCTGA
ncbi:MAG: integrase arm-type DNA-binding domain-containing protein [Methylocella sp.]